MIAAEVALSLVLLTVAGLLVHSFSRLYEVQPGVRINNTLTMGTSLAGPGYRDRAKRSASLGELGDRLRTVPGVASVGLTSCAPLTGQCNTLFFYIEGRPYSFRASFLPLWSGAPIRGILQRRRFRCFADGRSPVMMASATRRIPGSEASSSASRWRRRSSAGRIPSANGSSSTSRCRGRESRACRRRVTR